MYRHGKHSRAWKNRKNLGSLVTTLTHVGIHSNAHRAPTVSQKDKMLSIDFHGVQVPAALNWCRLNMSGLLKNNRITQIELIHGQGKHSPNNVSPLKEALVSYIKEDQALKRYAYHLTAGACLIKKHQLRVLAGAQKSPPPSSTLAAAFEHSWVLNSKAPRSTNLKKRLACQQAQVTSASAAAQWPALPVASAAPKPAGVPSKEKHQRRVLLGARQAPTRTTLAAALKKAGLFDSSKANSSNPWNKNETNPRSPSVATWPVLQAGRVSASRTNMAPVSPYLNALRGPRGGGR